MQIPANIALVKNLTLHGVFWGSYMQNNPRVLQQSLMELVNWLDEGRITVPVSHRYIWYCTVGKPGLEQGARHCEAFVLSLQSTLCPFYQTGSELTAQGSTGMCQNA